MFMQPHLSRFVYYCETSFYYSLKVHKIKMKDQCLLLGLGLAWGGFGGDAFQDVPTAKQSELSPGTGNVGGREVNMSFRTSRVEF